MLRVHRTEAIRMLLQAAICQERIYAGYGSYDTSQCQPASEYQHYRVTYASADTRPSGFIAMAIPQGAQLDDPCGRLSLNQNGEKDVGANDISVSSCWNGR
jgi:type IV pilus assembly protein PilE